MPRNPNENVGKCIGNAELDFLANPQFLWADPLLGNVYESADIADKLADSPNAFSVTSSTMLLLAAFGIKAALFPFFFWLPASWR